MLQQEAKILHYSQSRFCSQGMAVLALQCLATGIRALGAGSQDTVLCVYPVHAVCTYVCMCVCMCALCTLYPAHVLPGECLLAEELEQN